MRVNSVTNGFLTVVLALMLSGCGGPPDPGSGTQDQPATSQGIPELTKEIIDERINDAYVRDVPPESGTGAPIHWSFDHDEPKEIVVVEKKVNGERATIVLDVKTQSSPRASNLRVLEGQIRTEWQLETGWVLRQWMIDQTENISMKYKDLPKPGPTPPPLNR